MNLKEFKNSYNSDAVTKNFIDILTSGFKKYLDLQCGCAKMDEDEMNEYIENIGRTELFDELENINNENYTIIRPNCSKVYPRYLKAIRVGLVAQGYDENWVNTTFRDALEKRYLSNF